MAAMKLQEVASLRACVLLLLASLVACYPQVAYRKLQAASVPPPPRLRPPPPSPRSPPPSPPPPPPSPPPPSPSSPPPPPPPPPPSAPPQYYISFGKCGPNLQKVQYGAWAMTRSERAQTSPDSIVMFLDTKNKTHVAPVFGTVEPETFPMQSIYFAYFNKTGIKMWSPNLDATPYKESPSWYTIKVNGRVLNTIRDLKDSGTKTPMTASYSLKGTLNGAIFPSATKFRIEVTKSCDDPKRCSSIPDPATVFTSPVGLIVWSTWSVKQSLYVNGVYVKDHAWCPVQTVLNVP
ncbi:hypothetical protein Agub_g14972 [Astrephomene gubernaculifera]|uniref:Uncharacterized protein n=1 Tax=Astrephomene gubernaculifera TaxID=47775 RepID=A0AAD3E2Y9_9CHLO|nr:hypothetical protein Agub_g14972 [Astrephomene gubernaculifera]